MTNDTDLNDSARKCAVRYLEKVKGYTIEAEDFHGFIVALDEKQLVFASCGAAVSDRGEYPDSRRLRQEAESASFMWCMEQELVGDMPVRFDCIDMVMSATDSDRAMLRHHIHCYGA